MQDETRNVSILFNSRTNRIYAYDERKTIIKSPYDPYKLKQYV